MLLDLVNIIDRFVAGVTCSFSALEHMMMLIWINFGAVVIVGALSGSNCAPLGNINLIVHFF